MRLVIGTLAYSVLSSVVPVFNIEIYLAAIATQVDTGRAVPLAIAAGFGQAVGKLVWVVAIRQGMDVPWMQRRLENPKRQEQLKRWEDRLLARPWLSGGVTFLSGLIGVPPLLVMGVVAGVLRVNLPVFFFAIWLGRGIQSWLILAGLASVFH